MSIQPVLVSGTAQTCQTTLCTYDYNTQQGNWQMCIVSIMCELKKDFKNFPCKISCNLCIAHELQPPFQSPVEIETPLHIFTLNGKKFDIINIPIPSNLYHNVTSDSQQILKFTFTELVTEIEVNNCIFHVLLNFRKQS